jgi:hypothetical protein
MWPGHPSALDGAQIVTDLIDGASSGNVVTNAAGERIGVYLDDSTPDLGMWVTGALDEPGAGLIFVSVPMATPHKRWGPRVVSMLEWYPINAGFARGRMTTCQGYILQKAFKGYLSLTEPHADLKPPTTAQFQSLLKQARAHHPKYIWLF